jgi:fluoride exporter
MMLENILFVGTGSFFGGIARFLASKYIQNRMLSGFPFGTLAVNIAGCLLIGFLYGLAERTNILTPGLRTFLTVGFCGGFTTFSTFANESSSLLKDGNILYFALYVSGSVFLGILATYLGNMITRLV